MRRIILGLIALGFGIIPGFAQSVPVKQDTVPAGSHSISMQLNLPITAFANSHIVGIGADYSWSPERIGPTLKFTKPLGWLLTGGAHYYLGKKAETAGYSFRFGGYTEIQGLGGALYRLKQKGYVWAAGGAVLNIYEKNTDIGWAAQAGGNYYLQSRIGLGPVLQVRKYNNAEALWNVSIRASYIFH